MAMTLAEIRAITDGLNIGSKLVPDGSALLLNLDGAIAAVELYDDGRVLDMMVINFGRCPHDSPHKPAINAVLNELNTRARSVRFSWRNWREPGSDKEPDPGIYLRTELFLMDGKLSPPQLLEYLRALVAWHVRAGTRVAKVAETGIDPGDAQPQPAAAGTPTSTPEQPINKL
jgi:hypothetical protein